MKALINAIANVINVLVISMLVFIIFAIVGVNYFKGQLFYCNLEITDWPDVR